MIRNSLIWSLWVAIAIVSSSCNKTGETHSADRHTTSKTASQGSDKIGTDESASPRSVALTGRDPTRAEAWHRLSAEWDGLPKEFSGEELLKKQKEFSLRAVGELGAGPELLEFLDYLRERGAGDVREWVLAEGIEGLFSGAGAAEARAWLLTVEDEALRKRFLRQAGEEWAGAGFLGYMDQWDHFHGGQAELLTGYCATLAKSDPMAAFKAFKEMGTIKKINYETLDQVIMQSPPTADFLKMATFFGEDNKTLAKTSRRAVLTKWAETNPKEAGQYVIGNTQTVHADQMEVVAAGWARKSVSEATQWLNALSPGLPRDHGMRGLAGHFKEQDPARAFSFATAVGDFDLKVKTATEVFEVWEVTDRAAAEAAWLKAFSE
jgi:hypothetical protein